MESLIIAVHVLAAIGITGLVLLQHGKGADMGASFGSGASQTIFGSVGSGNALTKSTSWLAVVFFVTSLTLAVFARNQADRTIESGSLLQNPDAVLETQPPVSNTPAELPELPAEAAPEPEPAPAEAAAEAPANEAPADAETVEPQPETTEN